MGDFNENESNPATETFLNQYKCENIIKSKTCYKSCEASWMDLIITSRPSLTQFSQVFKTGITNSFHRAEIYVHKVRTKNL